MARVPSLSLVWWYEHLLCLEENISAEVMAQLGRLVEEQTEGLPTHVQARLYLRALRTPPGGAYAPPLSAIDSDALQALCTLTAATDLMPSDALSPEVLRRLRPPPALIDEVAAAHLARRLAAAVRSKKKIPTQQQVQEHLQELTRAAGCEDIIRGAGLQTKVVRINRVLNTNVATTSKGGLAPKAAADLSAALEAAASADAVQRKMDAYVASAWAALGPSYLQEHEQEVLANPAAAGPLALYGRDWTEFAAAIAGAAAGGAAAGTSAAATAADGTAAAAAADGAGPSAAAAPEAPATAEQGQTAGCSDGAAQPSGGRWLRSMGGATPALKLPPPKRGKRGAAPPAGEAAAGTSEQQVAAAGAEQQQQQQAGAETAEATPGKRGRGRPRKSSTAVAAAAAPAGEQAGEGAAVAGVVAAAPAGDAEAVVEQPAAAPVAFIVSGAGEQPFLAPLAPAAGGAAGGALDAAAAAVGGGYDLGLDGGDLKRRKTIRWTPEETDFFIQLVYKHGPGNWKAVMAAAEGELNNRTQVDLKDKWRNLENTGRVLRDRSDQLRAVGLLHDGPQGGDDAYYGD